MQSQGRPKHPFSLSEHERRTLERWARRRSMPTLALRSQIVLACANQADNRTVAEKLGVTEKTVGKWRARFVRERLDGLADEPRPGAPRKVTDELAGEVIRKTVEELPATARAWSTRSLAEEVGLSHSTVLRIWNAHGVRPEPSGSRRRSIRAVGQIVRLHADRL